MVNYVKFIRGSKTAWDKLIKKDPDTLYFIYEDINDDNGILYLGDKIISGGSSSFSEITGINFDNLSDGDLLVYNEESNTWSVKPPIQAVPIMTGATSQTDGTAGLVPVPKAGNNNLFLQGNGKWADPVPAILKKQVKDLVALDAEKSAREIAAEESAKVKNSLTAVLNNLTSMVNTMEEQIEGSMGQTDQYITKISFSSQVGNLTDMFNYNSSNNTIVDAVNELNDRLIWQKII